MNIFKNNEDDYQSTLKILYINAFVSGLNPLWDWYGLGVREGFTKHVLIKYSLIALTFVALQTYRIKALRDWMTTIVYSTTLIYSYYHVEYVHYSYYQAFFQYLIVAPLVLKFKKVQFIVANIAGALVTYTALSGLNNIPLDERNFSSETLISYFILLAFVGVWYISVINKKAKDDEKDKIFIELGKASSFLLHEISGPINRLEQSGAETTQQRREIEKMKSLLLLSKAVTNSEMSDIVNVTPISSIIDYNISNYKRTMDKLEITLNYKASNIKVKTNAQFLDVIVKNLILNAIEYFHSDPDISRKVITIDQIIHSSKLRVTFSNTCEKKSKTEINKMFTPLYSSKESTSANQGLGLFISSKMANSLGLDLKAFYKEEMIHFQFDLPTEG